MSLVSLAFDSLRRCARHRPTGSVAPRGSGQLVVGTNGTAATGGTVTLSNANTYSGDTFVRSGALAFTSAGSVANSALSVRE